MRNFNTSLVTFKQIKHTETDNKILVEGIIDKPQAKLTEQKSGPNCGVGSHSCHPFCKSAIVKEVKHTDVLILNQFVDSKGEMYSQEDLGICMVGSQSLDIILVHLDVEELLAPALLCHKEPVRSKQNTPHGGISKAPSRGLWMRRAGSLWHKRADASNSSEVPSTSR